MCLWNTNPPLVATKTKMTILSACIKDKVKDSGVIWKDIISLVCMPNVKSLSLRFQKLWPSFKAFRYVGQRSRSIHIDQNYWHNWERPLTRNLHQRSQWKSQGHWFWPTFAKTWKFVASGGISPVRTDPDLVWNGFISWVSIPNMKSLLWFKSYGQG